MVNVEGWFCSVSNLIKWSKPKVEGHGENRKIVVSIDQFFFVGYLHVEAPLKGTPWQLYHFLS